MAPWEERRKNRHEDPDEDTHTGKEKVKGGATTQQARELTWGTAPWQRQMSTSKRKLTTTA